MRQYNKSAASGHLPARMERSAPLTPTSRCDAFHLGRTATIKVRHRPAAAAPASPPMRKPTSKAGPFICLSRARHSSLHANSSVALLRVEPTQRRTVAQQDPAPLWHLDRRRIFQMLERARNGLDGEAEIVGDILTRHR